MHSGWRTAFRISSRALYIKHVFLRLCSGNMIIFHDLALPGENFQTAGGQAYFCFRHSLLHSRLDLQFNAEPKMTLNPFLLYSSARITGVNHLSQWYEFRDQTQVFLNTRQTLYLYPHPYHNMLASQSLTPPNSHSRFHLDKLKPFMSIIAWANLLFF